MRKRGAGEEMETSLPNAQFHNPCYEIGHEAEVLRLRCKSAVPLRHNYQIWSRERNSPIRLATKAAAEAAEPSRSRPLGPGMDLDISSHGILQKKTIRGHLNLNI